MEYREVIARLQSLADPRAVEGMARFGINTANTWGVSVTTLRRVAKEIGRDHGLAQQLWASGSRDARILAAIVDDPALVDEAQMEHWVADFDSWDVCDGCCFGLFDRTPFAYRKAADWSARPEEFVRRAGFALMASLAAHDKKAPDESFLAFLPLMEQQSGDDRNFVRKAVNWALRTVGKRNVALNAAAIETARRIRETGTRSGRWIAADALRELTGGAVQQRLQARAAAGRGPTSAHRAQKGRSAG